MNRDDTRWRTSVESKQREKYETNQIHQNIGGKLGLLGIAGRSACADNNNDNEHRPGNRDNNNPADDYQLCGKHRHLHPGLGLFHVPNDNGCGARAVLLHKGYNGGRSSRSRCKLIGDPSGHAGHCLLLNRGRSGCRAQSRVGPASACSSD